MKVVNLWESKQKDNYIYFTSIEEYLDALRNKSTVPYLSFKEKYTLGEEPETYLETAALKSDITLIYTDKDHPIMYDPKGYIPTVINKTKKINEEELLSSFPYIYNPNNPTEAYLENKPHTL